MLRNSFAFLAAAAVAFAPGSVIAQGPRLPPTFGIEAGVNLAKLGGSDVTDAKILTGFVGGVYGIFHVNEFFGFQPEALFSQKGTKFTGNGTAKVKLDYIEVPLLARLDIPMMGSGVPFVVLGPAFDFQTTCKLEATSGGVSGSVSCSDAGFDNKKFDVAGTVGVGIGFKTGKQTLSVSARYTHGFMDVESSSNAKNRVWSFLAGLSF